MQLLLIVLLLIPMSANAYSSDRELGIEVSAIKDILHNFTYELKPVHPGCVRAFEVSLADSPPPVVRSVDVRACVSSNEFYMPFKTGEDGYISYEYDLGGGEKGTFAYKFIGKSDSGIFVLSTRSNTGGTLVAESVYLIKDSFENYSSFDNKDEESQDRRLVITCVGQITLGDRDSGSVSLSGNTLTLGKSQYREKEVTINLEDIK